MSRHLLHTPTLFAILVVLAGVRHTASASEPNLDAASYFKTLRADLRKEWPRNRSIRFVFPGYSVPAGMARFVILYERDTPQSIYFAGCSFD